MTYDCKMEEVEILPNNVSIFHRPKQLNLLEAQAFFGLCTVKKRSSAGEKRYYKRLMSEANEENDDELISKFGVTIYYKDMHQLRPRQWLNDEVINFYLQLLVRETRSEYNSIHLFNTFFFVKYTQPG